MNALVSVCAAMAVCAAMCGWASDDPKKEDPKPAPAVLPEKPASEAPAPTIPKPAGEPKPEVKPAEKQGEKPREAVDPYVLGFTVKDIDGADKKLDEYKGKVVLIVNVASKCGYTPQYKELQKLYDSKKEQGLVVLGFPANNFGGQEPGSNSEIKEFCTSKYSVTFPMFAKISVKGEDQHPLYKKLAAQAAPVGGDPQWNFTKFLVDRTGRVVKRFDSRIKPSDEALARAVDELLGAK